MKNIRNYLIVVLISFLSGCATPSLEVSDLREPARTSTFVLPEMAPLKPESTKFINVNSGTKQIGLLPGTYTAEKENAVGIFYLGPNPAIWQEVEHWALSSNLFVHRGGIWIPHDPKMRPRIYSYVGSFKAVQIPIEQIRKTGPIGGIETTHEVNEVISRLSVQAATSQPGIAGGAIAGVVVGLLAALAEEDSKDPFFVSEEITDPKFVEIIMSVKKSSSNKTGDGK